ncbi:MAG: tRNA preQ1(34) S-adenosylmethionine ribosyltransferase-isomerase QueA [Planctomycetota bacterium]|nr:MAG: tRNA preQ1(34) S-adenosylmethionine ribosyltransferase-isomerase QueA [Planctomycetota bacterium]
MADYDYELPKRLIAQHPISRRSDARLLVVRRADDSLEHHHIRDLPGLLAKGDCLVINDTRVLPARLVGFRTATGGRWEGLFISCDEQGNWRLLGKSRGKLEPGEHIALTNEQLQEEFRLRLLLKEPEGSWIARPEVPGTPVELLERVGRVPLPPYIRHGEMVDADRDRYQTVFAERPGAVAAPTAGLHFTEALLKLLENNGVQIVRVTLHVGQDTFRPVSTDNLEEHQMHSEWCEITPEAVETIAKCRAGGGRSVAVGTTCVRVLETAARNGTLAPFSGPTDLFIRPPYEFRAVDALLTNFHLPRTTLLVLVRTFGGDALMRRAYEEAVREEYRFYSYGDAMLIF